MRTQIQYDSQTQPFALFTRVLHFRESATRKSDSHTYSKEAVLVAQRFGAHVIPPFFLFFHMGLLGPIQCESIPSCVAHNRHRRGFTRSYEHAWPASWNIGESRKPVYGEYSLQWELSISRGKKGAKRGHSFNITILLICVKRRLVIYESQVFTCPSLPMGQAGRFSIFTKLQFANSGNIRTDAIESTGNSIKIILKIIFYDGIVLFCFTPAFRIGRIASAIEFPYLIKTRLVSVWRSPPPRKEIANRHR